MRDIIQGSPEWFAIRLGKVTASRVCDVVAKTKSGPSASRANYMAQLIAERLTGVAAESYSNGAMAHGIEYEADARAAYEFYQGASVAEVGFVAHPLIEQAGCSPDGLVGDDGLVEIKCPNTATHLETLLGGGPSGREYVPEKYLTQIQFQLACTERLWCDFVSYDPRLPQAMRLFVCRVLRNEKRIFELETEVTKFLSDLNDKMLALVNLYGIEAAA